LHRLTLETLSIVARMLTLVASNSRYMFHYRLSRHYFCTDGWRAMRLEHEAKRLFRQTPKTVYTRRLSLAVLVWIYNIYLRWRVCLALPQGNVRGHWDRRLCNSPGCRGSAISLCGRN